MPLTLLKGIRRFKRTDFPNESELYQALKDKQAPEFLFITCSDSRIIPSKITHAKAGELFVIRNAGNIVPPKDSGPSSEGAAIEFALKKLQVKEIIICGHSHCGAMGALLAPDLEKELPAVAAWLSHVQASSEKLQKKYPHIKDADPHMCVTKRSLLEQIENLKTLPSVKNKLERKELNIHAWLYDIGAGEVLMYNSDHNDFIAFEIAVAEAFSSDYILKKMHAIVEKETMNPYNSAEYQQLMRAAPELKSKGVAVIWNSIKGRVTEKLWAEFGELCDSRGKEDPRFVSLLEQCPKVKLSELGRFSKELSESRGYQQFCSERIRRERKNSLNLAPESTEKAAAAIVCKL